MKHIELTLRDAPTPWRFHVDHIVYYYPIDYDNLAAGTTIVLTTGKVFNVVEMVGDVDSLARVATK